MCTEQRLMNNISFRKAQSQGLGHLTTELPLNF